MLGGENLHQGGAICSRQRTDLAKDSDVGPLGNLWQEVWAEGGEEKRKTQSEMSGDLSQRGVS